MGHNHYLLRRDCIKAKAGVRQILFIKIHSENKGLQPIDFIQDCTGRSSENISKTVLNRYVQPPKSNPAFIVAWVVFFHVEPQFHKTRRGGGEERD